MKRKKQSRKQSASSKKTTSRPKAENATKSGSESWHQPAAPETETPSSTEQLNKEIEEDTGRSGML